MNGQVQGDIEKDLINKFVVMASVVIAQDSMSEGKGYSDDAFFKIVTLF